MAPCCPQTLAGTSVTLQMQTNGAWATVGQTQLGADGAFSIPWTAAAAGTYSFRLQVPAAHGLVATTSPGVPVTVTATSSPWLSDMRRRIH